MQCVSAKGSGPTADCCPTMWLVGRTPRGEFVMWEVCRTIGRGLWDTDKKGLGLLFAGWLEGGEFGAEFELELVLLELFGVIDEDDGVEVEDDIVEPDSVPEIACNEKRTR